MKMISFSRIFLLITLRFQATSNLFLSLLVVIVSVLSTIRTDAAPPVPAGAKVTFSFTVKVAGRTSAGVFQKDGTLIRTLWSGVPYKAGKYTKVWNGTDDEGRLVASGDYDIKVLTNDVKYTWEGVIGNTSAQSTGPTVHRGLESIRSMAVVGNVAYYAKGYSEGNASQSKFLLDKPQADINLTISSGSSQGSWFSATDGVNVYWAGNDAFSTNGNKWFVFATTVNGDKEVEFLNGNSLKLARGGSYKSSIAVVDNGVAKINGIAVQKKGKYLFVSCKEQNEIQVYDKTTGAVVQSIPMKSPGNVAVDNDDNLWVISRTSSVQKYRILANGALEVVLTTLTGLVEPLAIAVSPRDNIVLVADGGASQQLKAFDNTSGQPAWTFGQEGGYTVNADVANDKFYFTDPAGRTVGTFVTFQPDGSFWVGDTGNSRAMHYAADKTYLNCIMFLPIVYSSFVDANKPERVFANYLEFRVDYAKPLAPDNGSWTLVRNWGALVPTGFDDKYQRLRGVSTLTNGRTYACLMRSSPRKPTLVELTSAGTMRFTGVDLESQLTQLYPDGSLRRLVAAYGGALGKSQSIMKRALTGFDGAGNPTWAAEAPMASSPPATRQDPIFWGNTLKLRTGEVTSSDILISFDGGLPPYGSDGYHLGGIRLKDNKWLWRTAKSTDKQYSGPYPADGAYDTGNGAQYGGTVAMAIDRSIIWGYHGEFWKASQTNKWSHVYDNGLFIGTFGVTGPEVAGQEAPGMMAGNVFSPSLVKDNAGNIYLYHNDESYHSGLHRWKITGLSTIQEQSVPVTFTRTTGGLTGYYFQSSDLNNLMLKTTRLDPQVDFNWSEKRAPAGTQLADTADYSVRWKGFVETPTAEEYTFYIKTTKGARFWIDDKLLVDKWANTAFAEHTAVLTMEAGKQYPIRIETKGGSPVSFQWASARQPRTAIPSRYLSPGVDETDSIRYDLLYGLTNNAILQNGLYGWQRNPAAEDYTDRYTDWWQVATNRKTYRKGSPDLWAMFRQQSGTYSVSRDLGTTDKQKTWSLNGRISYDGNEGNEVTGTGGSFLDVLDKAGKVIARTFVDINYTGRIMTVYGNTAPIATNPQSQIRPIIDEQQPISITADSTGITFTYANYPPVKTKVFDTGSDWRSPRTMRLSFFTNGRNVSRIFGIERMYFITASGSESIGPTDGRLFVYPNPTQSTLNVQHPAATDTGSLAVFSLDGRLVSVLDVATGLTDSTIDTGSLAPGMYILQYKNGETRMATRFIKQ